EELLYKTEDLPQSTSSTGAPVLHAPRGPGPPPPPELCRPHRAVRRPGRSPLVRRDRPVGRQRPQHTLARLGARTADPALAVRRPPSPDTIRRVLIALPPTHLTTLACAEDLSVLIVKKMRKKASHIFTDSSLFYPSCLPVFEDIDEI